MRDTKAGPEDDRRPEAADANVIPFPRQTRCSPPDLSSAFREHNGELTGWLSSRTESPDTAQEVGQEVWLRMSRQSLERIANVRAYLFRTARSVLIDRGRASRVRGTSEEIDERVADDAPGAERQLLGCEALTQLQLLLDQLPPAQRQALIWARIDGLTMKEVGRRLGVSESMACRYLSDALRFCQVGIASDRVQKPSLRIVGSDPRL